MMVRAIGQIQYTNMQHKQEQQTQTKFYHPQDSKVKVKKDFDALLQQEVRRINFSTII